MSCHHIKAVSAKASENYVAHESQGDCVCVCVCVREREREREREGDI
jgi:hypothetical protein